MNASELTHQAIEALSSGDRATARKNLVAALRSEPSNETAWLWLSQAVDDPAERRYCLERAVSINPKSVASRALPELPPGDARPPEELRFLDEPPVPPDLAALAEVGVSVSSHRRRNLALAVLVTILAASVLAIVLWNGIRSQEETLTVALVAPLTGERAAVGQEMQYAVQHHFAAINEKGGIDGHRIEVLVYDDANDPELAKQRAQEIVNDGRALVVIGHSTSSTSMAAAPIYQGAGIPAISGSATADALTVDYPLYYRTLFSNSQQGQFMGAYAYRVLGLHRAATIYTDDVYGQTLNLAFVDEFANGGAVVNQWALPADPAAKSSAIQSIVVEATGTRPAEILYLAMLDRDAHDLILALRRGGYQGLIFGTDSIGRPSFALSFQDEPEEREKPGTFTDGVYTASPLIFNTATAEAQDLAAQYQLTYNTFPSWTVAKYHDAAVLAAHAIDAADVENASETRGAERVKIRAALEAVNSEEAALDGINGPLYLDAQRSAVQPIAIGMFMKRLLQSAPRQLMPVLDRRSIDLAAEIAAGHLLKIGDQLVRVVEVVYTGMDVNEIGEVNLRESSYLVDFYLWFRYTGDDEATNIVFTNAAQSGLTLGEPIRSSTLDNVNYRLYRVKSKFREHFDFRDYPFDQQNLYVRMQNADATRDQILYVVDRPANSEKLEGLVVSVGVPDRLSSVESWIVRGILLFQDVTSIESTFGDPRYGDESVRIEYSRFNANIRMQRDVQNFLIKNLLPLLLLTTLLYVSFFLPFGGGTAIRINLAVTGILTSAVLLGNISNRLPDIGYTVAIEYGFYVFFGLALGCIIVAIIGDRLNTAKEEQKMRRLSLAVRLIYPLLVLAVVVVYLVRYRP